MVIIIIPIAVTLPGIVILDRNGASIKALVPMDVTVLGIDISLMGHPVYIKLLIVVVPTGMVIAVDVCSVYLFISGSV